MKYNYLILFAIAFAVLSSCTIEKRLYMPGYHVEMKNGGNKFKRSPMMNSNQHKLDHPITTENVDFIAEVPDNYEETNDIVAFIDLEALEKDPISSPINVFSSNQSLEKHQTKFNHYAYNILSKVKRNNPPHSVTEGSTTRTVHWSALVSFISGILGLLLIGIAIDVIIGIVLGICAILFGIIGISAISRNPEEYKGKGYAIAGLAIGILIMTMVVIVIALLASL